MTSHPKQPQGEEAGVTPWFPGDVKPVRVGVYQTEDANLGDDRFYNYWDGKRWYYGHAEFHLADPDISWTGDEWKDGAKSLKRWRGLAEQPK